jgi:tetratricopeptide (TPR) repeat protein
LIGENHPDTAIFLNNIGLIYYKQGNYEKTLENYEKALKLTLSLFGENHPNTALSLGNIGSVYYN